MFATPIRWFLMLGVAACGYFTITSGDMGTRAAAFIGSVVCWQFHYIVMMYEADAIRNYGLRKKQREDGAPAAAPALPMQSPEASV